MQSKNKEIERKWLVNKWPDLVGPSEHYIVHQSYIHVDEDTELRLTVRYKPETYYNVERVPVMRRLTFKSGHGLERTEIQMEITQEQLEKLQSAIDRVPIVKDYRIYPMAPNLIGVGQLEISQVDPGSETSFMYAEVEFSDKTTAMAFGLPEKLFPKDTTITEVTGDPQYAMKNYWMGHRG